MKKYRILLVDDDPLILNTIGPALKDHDYDVTTAENGQVAIEQLDKHKFDLVLTDLVMEEIDGITVLKKVKKVHPETVVIILTGYGDLQSAVEALRFSADDYLLKPSPINK